MDARTNNATVVSFQPSLATLPQMNMEVEKGPTEDYYPLYRALYELIWGMRPGSYCRVFNKLPICASMLSFSYQMYLKKMLVIILESRPMCTPRPVHYKQYV